jgi:tetratricopeptide (TPR) repeat protein/predicted Ser/Thr protein kinase
MTDKTASTEVNEDGSRDDSTRTLDSSDSLDDRRMLAPGRQIDRYLIIAKLGAGGMGVVFAAYDPKLDRKIAIKLLGGHGIGSRSARERLQREAQALAKLDHPNVVGVFDVGTHEDLLFVTMEFVAGQTLGAWMRSVESPRPWKQVLEVFMAAGRGLAAAHEAGLVHRDFKPDNVMLGEDGRVRVMDFGLARVVQGNALREQLELSDAPVERLTKSGAMVGTVMYMPLEQFRGQGVDARSDQFSFCVALYEALYGERPFAGTTVSALKAAVHGERIGKPPENTSVPAWLREVVVRGLARDAERRWPSMQVLLDALGNDPVPRRRRRLLAGGLLVALAGGVGWVTDALQADAQFCKHAAKKLDGVWDKDRRAAVEQAILGTELSYAPGTWERVEWGLDVYAAAWAAAREQACEATRHGEQSDELMDLRMACLDERLSLMGKTIDELARADAALVENAAQAVLGLPGLERCADIEALMAEIAPPENPVAAMRVAALDEQLLEAKAKDVTGRYVEALTLADTVVVEAATLDYEPLMARASLRQGLLQKNLDRYEDAEVTLRQALDAALACGMRAEAADASTELVGIVGYRQAKPDQARRWVELSKPLVRAAGTPEAQAFWLTELGNLAAFEGKFADAREYHEDALAIFEQALGPEHPQIAVTLNNLGNAAGAEGKLAEARDYYERALAITKEVRGPEHPEVSVALGNLGIVAKNEGKFAEARDYSQQALAIKEKTLGPEHLEVAFVLNTLGSLADLEGKYAEARGYYDRALVIVEKALGPEHPVTAALLNNLGVVAESERKLEEARGYYERALAIKEKALGSEHPDIVLSLNNLGNALYQQGKLDEARGHYERALAIAEKALSPDHPDIGYPATALGRVLIDLGKPVEALQQLERALSIRTAHAGDPTQLAETRFVLARALWEAPAGQGRDRVRGRELAELARTTYAEAGKGSARHLSDVETWLIEHPE